MAKHCFWQARRELHFQERSNSNVSRCRWGGPGRDIGKAGPTSSSQQLHIQHWLGLRPQGGPVSQRNCETRSSRAHAELTRNASSKGPQPCASAHTWHCTAPHRPPAGCCCPPDHQLLRRQGQQRCPCPATCASCSAGPARPWGSYWAVREQRQHSCPAAL